MYNYLLIQKTTISLSILHHSSKFEQSIVSGSSLYGRIAGRTFGFVATV